eukprot:3825781-Pyramimonas_sp.AAC.1
MEKEAPLWTAVMRPGVMGEACGKAKKVLGAIVQGLSHNEFSTDVASAEHLASIRESVTLATK